MSRFQVDRTGRVIVPDDWLQNAHNQSDSESGLASRPSSRNISDLIAQRRRAASGSFGLWDLFDELIIDIGNFIFNSIEPFCTWFIRIALFGVLILAVWYASLGFYEGLWQGICTLVVASLGFGLMYWMITIVAYIIVAFIVIIRYIFLSGVSFLLFVVALTSLYFLIS